MANVEQDIVKQSRLQNKPIPERIKNAPVLRPGLDLYLSAFFDLDGDRQIGFGVGKIPWSSMAKYAEMHKFSQSQFEDLVFLLRRMDAEHLKRLEANRVKNPAGSGKKS